jgi:hypothetical protein
MSWVLVILMSGYRLDAGVAVTSIPMESREVCLRSLEFLRRPDLRPNGAHIRFACVQTRVDPVPR